MERPKQFERSPESEVWSAIAAFEEILAAMPDDRTALETLFDAYDHIGDKARALEYLVKLTQQICEEGDTDPVSWIYASLTRIGGESPEALKAKADLEQMADAMGLPTPSEMVAPARVSKSKSVDVSAEVALAWQLHQSAQVTQDEYSMLVQDLTENSTKDLDVPVSVVHVMQDRTFKDLPRVLAHMSQESGTPFIQIVDFAFNRQRFDTLSPEFTERRGAIVFDEMGGELLVALLNPFNEDLKREIRESTQRSCHFYLCSAEDYDVVLSQSRQTETAEAAV